MSAPRPAAARAALPWLWAAVLGLGGVLVFALALFEREHRRHGALLDAQRNALLQYASTSLTRQLEDAWRLGLVRLDAALDSPLESSAGVAAFDLSGRLLVPRIAQGPAEAPRLPDDGPIAERWALARRARSASEAGDAQATEATVRALLSHRRQYRLPPRDDVVPLLEVLEALHRSPRTPAPELLRLALREGFAPGVAEEGLQRAVRRGWNQLPDAAELCRRIATLSEQHLVDSSGLSCEDEPPPPSWLTPPFPAALALRCEARSCWLVAQHGDEAAAVQVDVPLLVAGLSFEMRHRGLLDADDALELHQPGGMAPLEAVRPWVRLPRLDRAAEEDRQELWLKRALVLLTLALGLGAAALTALDVRRRARFVELKSDFVATMSHELRTPLTGLRVMAETLERRLRGVDAAKDYPQRMVRQLDTLGALVENVLSFDRVEQGRWTLHRAPWRPAALVPFLEEEARTLDRPVQVDGRGLDAAVELDADEELLRLLFSNLLRNAAIHTARPDAKVALTCERAGDALLLRFVDDGAGVAAADWERVFEPFERGADARGRRGSGLGLALCRRIARLHGGELSIEASSPAGTTWLLRLPAA